MTGEAGKNRVGIVGSRDWPISQNVRVFLAVHSLRWDSVVVSGGARGVDSLAVEYAKQRGMGTRVFKPREDIIITRGFAAAAFARNRQIVDDSERGIAFQHNKSRGTQDTIDHYKFSGKEVLVLDSKPLQVYTAHASYKGPDKLDITRASATLDGLPFAPSWALLNPFLEKRKGEGLALLDWELYKIGYLAEMRNSFTRSPADWSRLLNAEEVTLVCYCKGAEQCHRTILGAEILPKLGAEYRGERQMAVQKELF